MTLALARAISENAVSSPHTKHCPSRRNVAHPKRRMLKGLARTQKRPTNITVKDKVGTSMITFRHKPLRAIILLTYITYKMTRAIRRTIKYTTHVRIFDNRSIVHKIRNKQTQQRAAREQLKSSHPYGTKQKMKVCSPNLVSKPIFLHF